MPAWDVARLTLFRDSGNSTRGDGVEWHEHREYQHGAVGS